ncbi:MAG: NAD(P)-dependent oxidoreductase [Fimbriimonadaceae bacterium]|nr:NAD(P)-dependent oxidoreductase [Fimbriimonadaceae bacterium]
MKIAIYGAGGPVAAAAIRWLEADHELLLTDVKPFDTRHPFRECDVTDPLAVAAVAAGMDCLINCTVMRPHDVLAFDVNTRGAYNVVRAAVDHRVPRLIHTGPAQIFSPHGGYQLDRQISEAMPPHVGMGLYAISKYLGHDLVEAFCRQHRDLTTVIFYYCGFHSEDGQEPRWMANFVVHEDDAGQAFKLGVEVPRERLPSNCETFQISAELPLGYVDLSKAKNLLGYQPRHNFESAWRRQP